MPLKSCSALELKARIVAIETKGEAFAHLMDERDLRYRQLSESQDRAVATTLAAAKEAGSKAETAIDKRLEGLNELRAMANDQAKTFARADESNLHFSSLESRITDLTTQVNNLIASRSGADKLLSYVVAGIGLIIAAMAVYFSKGK